MKLLIIIPAKSAFSGVHYPLRMLACEETWLQGIPEAPALHMNVASTGVNVSYKGFTDADLGLVEIDQHNNAVDPIRTERTKRMAQYAYDHGYDYLFRTDSDTYVWINRLVSCGFESYDYMGWNGVGGPAHGGVGFFLSRRAMKIIADAPVERYRDGKYWGDLWTGMVLARHGIQCKLDTRFLDGSSGDHSKHDGNIGVDDLPMDHPYIAIHPCPFTNLRDIHAKMANLPAETIAPRRQIWAADEGV